jgi:hypothetical protein
MAHKIQLQISEGHYKLLDGFPGWQNPHCLQPSFKLDQSNGEFLPEPHLVCQSDTINLSNMLIPNTVHSSDSSGSGFNLSFGQTELTLQTMLGGHVYRPVRICFCSSLHLSQTFGNFASATNCLSPDFLQ